jgi:hypothetical protein
MIVGVACLFVATIAVVVCAADNTGLAQSHTATNTVTLQVSLSSHSSLRVSSSTLRFEVTGAGVTTTSLEFWAAARTRSGGEVVLTVQPVGPVQRPDGAPADPLSVACDQDGERGTLSDDGPQTIGRWVGGGLRQGRVVCTLRGATHQGSYTVPVKFMLSVP